MTLFQVPNYVSSNGRMICVYDGIENMRMVRAIEHYEMPFFRFCGVTDGNHETLR
jgi:hypothetical protein